METFLKQWTAHRQTSVMLWMTSFGLLIGGYFAGYLWPSYFQRELKPILSALQQLASIRHEPNFVLHAIALIFVNNLIVAALMIVCGIVFGIFPAWKMWFNGVLLGYVTAAIVAKQGVAAWKVLLYAVLPHGVLELTALLWASTLGLRLGLAAARYVARALQMGIAGAFGKDTRRARSEAPSLADELSAALHAFPYIAGCLLLAACIEVTVTPRLIHSLLLGG